MQFITAACGECNFTAKTTHTHTQTGTPALAQQLNRTPTIEPNRTTKAEINTTKAQRAITSRTTFSINYPGCFAAINLQTPTNRCSFSTVGSHRRRPLNHEMGPTACQNSNSQFCRILPIIDNTFCGITLVRYFNNYSLCFVLGRKVHTYACLFRLCFRDVRPILRHILYANALTTLGIPLATIQ